MPVEFNFGPGASHCQASGAMAGMTGMTLMLRFLLLSLFQNASAVGGPGEIKVGAQNPGIPWHSADVPTFFPSNLENKRFWLHRLEHDPPNFFWTIWWFIPLKPFIWSSKQIWWDANYPKQLGLSLHPQAATQETQKLLAPLRTKVCHQDVADGWLMALAMGWWTSSDSCGNGILMLFWWQTTMAAMWRSSVLRNGVLNPFDVCCWHKMVVTGNSRIQNGFSECALVS